MNTATYKQLNNTKALFVNRRDAIETAFKRLPIPKGREEFLPVAVAMFDNFDSSGLVTAPPAFCIVGKTRTKNEIDNIAKHATELARSLNSLHQPAVLALADAGLCNVRHYLPNTLSDIVIKIQQIDLSDVSETVPGGKPENVLARGVTTMLAYCYELLMEDKPTRRMDAYSDDNEPYGPFVDLVKEVFGILGISVNTEHVVREAILRYNKPE